MKDIEKMVVIFKSIVTLLMFVMLSFIEPMFIYIAGAGIIIGGAIVVTFAFISAPIHNDKESEKDDAT